MSRPSQQNAWLIQHCYSSYGTTQLEKTSKNIILVAYQTPKMPFFACFLKLGGSVWDVTVLDEPGILLRRSGHPTSLYLERKEFPKKIGPWKFRDWAQIALLGPPGTLKGSNTRSKCVFTMNLTQAGQWGAVGTKSGPSEPSEDLWGPRKGHFCPKRTLLGPQGPRKGPIPGKSVW